MKAKAGLVQKQAQTLAMTQSMQNALKILQCSQLELQQEIATVLENNIMLEQDINSDYEANEIIDDTVIDYSEADIDFTDNTPLEVIQDFSSYEDTGGVSDTVVTSSNDGFTEFDHSTYEESLSEYLIDQLSLLRLSDKDMLIGHYLIDMIDEKGYFCHDLNDINAIINQQEPELEATVDELNVVLTHIRQMDPTGIATSSLEESLIKQIEQLQPVPYWQEEAIDLLKYHSRWLTQGDLLRIEKKYYFLPEEVVEMLEGLKALNPYPAVNYATKTVEAVNSDIIVTQHNEQLTVSLNDAALPKLRINRKYARLAQRSRVEQRDLLRAQLTEARFFLKSVEDRFDTLLKVATAIVDAQQAFFIRGEIAMKSLVMAQIAEIVDLNESTVSRSVAGKYLICSRGTYPLSFFFTNRISMDSDEEQSAVAVRAVLQKIIDNEDKKKPYSDQKLQVLLADEGHQISRRTVAKYRDVLGIASSAQRKKLI